MKRKVIQVDMSVHIGKITLQSPLILGSHDDLAHRDNFERIALITKGKLGGFTHKTITISARVGNAHPQVALLDKGILVSSGLKNPGLISMLGEIEHYNKHYSGSPYPVLIGSIAVDPSSHWRNPEKELAYMALRLYRAGVKMIELNLSCPNTNEPHVLAEYPQQVYQIVDHIKNRFLQNNITDIVIIPKLTGFAGDLLASAKAAEKGGADAVLVSNIPAATGFHTGLFDPEKAPGTPLVGNIAGGYAGQGLGPIIRQMIRGLYPQLSIPIIGTSGLIGGRSQDTIQQLDGLIQSLVVGATAVSTVTPFYPVTEVNNLQAINNLIDGYARYLKERNLTQEALPSLVHNVSKPIQNLSNKTVRSVLIVGYGKVGNIHQQLWQRLGVQVSIVDPSKDNQALAKKNGLTFFADKEQALLAITPDVVDICTPTSTHFDILQSISKLAPSVNILIEKPVTNSIESLLKLQELSPKLTNRIMVNENYLFSSTALKLKELIDEYQLVNYRVFIEFSKDRTIDEAGGRFTDPVMGAFGIEISHALALVSLLGPEKDMETIINTSFSEDQDNNTVARLIYTTADGTLVHVYSSLTGETGGSFGQTEYSSEPKRKMTISADNGLLLIAYFEPVPGKKRFEGKIDVLKNGSIIQSIETIEDNSMLASLQTAKDYFEGTLQNNPSSLTLGMDITRKLLASTNSGKLLSGDYSSFKEMQWKYTWDEKCLPSDFLFVSKENHEDFYFRENNTAGEISKLRKYYNPSSTESAAFCKTVKVRLNGQDNHRMERYHFDNETLSEADFNQIIQKEKPLLTIKKNREIYEKNGIIIHVDSIAKINGVELTKPLNFLEIVTRDPVLEEKAAAVRCQLKLTEKDELFQPFFDLLSYQEGDLK